MFDSVPERKLLEKMGLGALLMKYGVFEYQNAME